MKTLYRATIANAVLLVILCGAYPIVVTVFGNLFFHEKASGGIIERGGTVIGARLIGQGFSKPEYFHGRPSSAGDKGYDASNSSGSNLGPTNQKMLDAVKGNVDQILKDNPTLKKGDIPTELATGSGSGLDPHISPEGAMAQIDRVAQARKIGLDQIRALVAEHTEGPQWGILGEATVNVLALNLALDKSQGIETAPTLLPVPTPTPSAPAPATPENAGTPTPTETK